MTALVIRGDARALPLLDASVDLIVTSPPYFGLRSYTDNGEHYDGQIGSEATPAEYVAELLDCTREWVRVLKPSGSLFVNLGDRYSPGEPLSREGMTIEDAAWLAGVIDSDGSVSVRINKQPEGRAPSFVPWVRVGQMRREVVEQIAAVTGIGRAWQDGRGVWNWCAAAQQCATVLRWIWPWLHIKQRPALAAVELARHIAERRNKGTWSPVSDDDVRYRQSLRDAVLAWNAGRPCDLEPPRLPFPSLPLRRTHLQAKSLSGLPWRYALGCIDELGLILRAEIIWGKVNGLPESVTDRVRRSHETWFHLTRQPRYYSAIDEIREPHIVPVQTYTGGHANRKSQAGVNAPSNLNGSHPHPLGKLPGSVWDIPSEPLSVPEHLGVEHFAAFPTEWCRRLILGWSPPGVCTECGEGRRPVVASYRHRNGESVVGAIYTPAGRFTTATGRRHTERTDRSLLGYACACPEPTAPTTPAVILDPFGGTGTTSLVASVLGRVGISVDRSMDYSRLARWRTTDPAQRAKAMRVEKPPEQLDGQGDLFAEEAS